MVTRIAPYILMVVGMLLIVAAVWVQFGWTAGVFVTGAVTFIAGVLNIEV